MVSEVDGVRSGRLAHHIEGALPEGGLDARLARQLPADQPATLTDQVAGAQTTTGRPALALTAEGPRRADLVAWAKANQTSLGSVRLFAPASVGTLLAEHVGLSTEPLPSGTVGPAATAGLAAAGGLDAMIAFTDPVALCPGDNTTRALTRVAVYWDIPIAGNPATADLLLAKIVHGRLATGALPDPSPTSGPAPGAVKLWNIRATLEDVPGRLAILAASLGRRAVNILSVQVHLTPDGPVDELLVAASPLVSAADLSASVVDGGARTPRVTPADAHALVDGPTRALGLATQLLRKPDDLPRVLVGLLPGAVAGWRAEEPAGAADDPTQLWLPDPTGGGYLLTRPAAPFTPAERARAYAMIEIVMLIHTQPRAQVVEAAVQSWQVALSDGAQLTVRTATPDDLDAVVELHQRCSLTSRLRRYVSGTRMPSTTSIARLLSPDSGHALVAEDAAGRVVALANLSWPSGARQAGSGTPELAILVEDAWQRRRVGSFLARRLLALAQERGVGRIRAVVNASNTAMVRIMSGLSDEPGRRMHREYDGGMLTLIVSMNAHHS